MQLGLKKYDKNKLLWQNLSNEYIFFSILIAIDFFFIIFFLVVPLLAGRYKFIQVIGEGESSLLISAEVRYTKCTYRLEIMLFNYSAVIVSENTLYLVLYLSTLYLHLYEFFPKVLLVHHFLTNLLITFSIIG